MASTSSQYADRPLMPGSFGPEDMIDFYSNPVDALQQLQDQWRSKDHGLDKLPELDLGDVDWHKYDAPRPLRTAPNVTSQILLDIVDSSITNIKARIAEEDRQKRQEEEQKRLAEEEAAREAQKGKEPYLPIIIVQEPREPGTATDDTISPEASAPSSGAGDGGSAQITAKIEKRRRFALRRLFQRSNDRGESSAMGAAREALRQEVENKPGGASGTGSNGTWAAFKQRLPASNDAIDTVECVSCLDDFSPKDAVKVTCHSYCAPCFQRLIVTAMDNPHQWPPKCCLNPIPTRLILRSLPSGLKKQFRDKAEELEVPPGERIYCHEPSCGEFIRPDRVLGASSLARCEQGHWTCSMCRGEAHDGEDCPHDQDLHLTNQLAEEEGWKRCYNCHALVEHRDACQHMTCRCGSHFCYVCGQRWQTCGCTMDQLHALKQSAYTRRQDRIQREQEEAEELRRALAQIEEFEREERLKAELLRQEQERLEEERRQLELEERVRQESLRRREVELKYQELRASLDVLHDLQQVLLETSREEAAAEQVAEAKAKKQRLAEKHEAERAGMSARILSRISAKEHDFNSDYATRVAQEKKIEEEYQQQLRAYWGGRKGGAAEADKAMLPLRRRMDVNHRLWQKWKNEELEAYRARLEDERTTREELMYSAAQRLADACEAGRVEAERRGTAEVKWFEVLMLERERLLAEAEVEEMEGDADSLFAPEQGEDEAVAREANGTVNRDDQDLGIGYTFLL